MIKDQFFKLTLVTNKSNKFLDNYLEFVSICAESGITLVQLREKNLSYEDLLEFGGQLKSLLGKFLIPLIVNDYTELAYQLDVDGVHLGQSDENVIEARRKLGTDKIIGLTVDSIEQLCVANTLPINYVGIGAIFSTNNKINVPGIWGANGLEKIAQLSKHPIIAIGGISETNAHAVMKAGANGIAAIEAFHEARDPSATTKNLRNIVYGINHA